MDPFLGFLHSIQQGKPSLVCDLQEPFRPLVDGFLLNYIKRLDKKDYDVNYQGKRPRIFLKHNESSKFISELNSFFANTVKKKEARFVNTRKIRTIFREDVENLARFLRKETKNWILTNCL